MDSGNSGSLQSSSGGDEEYEYDSTAFLNNNSSSLSSSTTHLGALITNSHQLLPPPSSSSSSSSHQHQHHHYHHQHQNPNHPTSLFDPLSNYFDVFTRSTPPTPPNPNSPLNRDMVWSRSEANLRSEQPNYSTDPHVGALMGTSSSNQSSIMGNAHQDFNRLVLPVQKPSSSMSLPDNSSAVRPSSVSASDQTNVVRQSKKRSRASRRAPTTVLTTDTSNFRAMVQEFTGIPAPPFSASPFPRSRFDLFNTAASTMRVGHLEPTRPPPYLLRPFAQKAVQPPPFAVSSTPGSASNTTSMNTTSNSTSSTNYQLLSELGLSKQSQNLAYMQNPLLTFQSLLQSTINNPQKFQLPNSSNFGENSQQGISSNTRMGGLEEFNVNHGQVRNSHLSELPNFVTSSDIPLLRNDHNIAAANHGDGVGSNNASEQGQLQSFNENYSNNSSQRVNNNCKMNYTDSSSQAKGSENNVITSRGGEGMVDSWICSSD
ncbi:hypothetical protein AQUCO_01500216v1 [Aquilegia coerulea]|uniref:VQ domain-containing protein n=1 Tax=Aquilegia coerulea TaxID=218851 RepID=A0A2G5DTC7_AQUCA|nr:hypothetical protein AQUCO_01500216v1 [Aquilegia coerulea]